MKGLKLVRGPLKPFSVVEFRVMVNAYPFNLILKLAGPFTALKNLFNFSFRLLIIDYQQGRLLMLF